jgi:hypothetical protein
VCGVVAVEGGAGKFVLLEAASELSAGFFLPQLNMSAPGIL